MSFIQTVFVIIFVVALYVFNAMRKPLIGVHVKFEKDCNVYEGIIISEMQIKKRTMDGNKIVANKYKLFEVDVGQKEPIVIKKEKLIIVNDYWKK